MTAAVFRTAPSFAVPQSQNTAPVLEFNCLYTQDVRKKQKKWQDGILRYHTFNKRVMLYDLPRNFIGDMHWTGQADLQAGDELRLERSGVMVEVADSIGQTETDLTELRKGKKQVPPVATCSVRQNAGNTSRACVQPKHRSLNALLGTPKGPIGKAVISVPSPFDLRYEGVENEDWEDGRPPKRPKTQGNLGNVTMTTAVPEPAKTANVPLWARTVGSAKPRKKESALPGHEDLKTKEIVDLTEDGKQHYQFLPGLSTEVLAGSSPARVNPPKAVDLPVESRSPAFQTQKTMSPQRRSATSAKQASRGAAIPLAKQPAPDSDRHTTNVKQVEQVPVSRYTPETDELPRGSNKKRVHVLRVAATAPRRRTLLCQEQLSKKLKQVPSTRDDHESISLHNIDDDPPPDRRLRSRRDRTPEDTSPFRCETTVRKASPREQISIVIDDDDEDLPDGPAMDNRSSDEEALTEARTSHENFPMALGRLDRMMLPSPTTTRTIDVRPLPPLPNDMLTEYAPSGPKHIAEDPHSPNPVTPQPREDQSLRRAALEGLPSDNHIPPTNPSRFKKPLQSSVSLNVTSNGTSAVVLSRPFHAPGKAKNLAKSKVSEPAPPQDVGPWSRDAFDLFGSWRPPGWDEEKWAVAQAEEGNGDS